MGGQLHPTPYTFFARQDLLENNQETPPIITRTHLATSGETRLMSARDRWLRTPLRCNLRLLLLQLYSRCHPTFFFLKSLFQSFLVLFGFCFYFYFI